MNTTQQDLKIRLDESQSRIFLPPHFPTKHHSAVFCDLVSSNINGHLQVHACANFEDWFMAIPIIACPPPSLGKRCLEYRVLNQPVLDMKLMVSNKYQLTLPEDLLIIIDDWELSTFLFRARRHICVFMTDRFGDICRVTISFDGVMVCISATTANIPNHRFDHYKIIHPGTLVLWSAKLQDQECISRK
jgi:hypothetical protein